MDFNIEDYNNPFTEFVMHCSTEEEALIFLEYLHKQGRSWSGGESYLSFTAFNNYREDTCYYFNHGTYGSLSYAKDEGCVILEFRDFFNTEPINEDNKSLDDFLNKFQIKG